MTLVNLIAYLTLFVALPLNWLVTIMLWRVSRQSPEIRVLRERAVTALALAIIATVFALIFLNNDAAVPPLSPEATRLITRTTILVATIVPSFYWLWLYRRASGDLPVNGDGDDASGERAELAKGIGVEVDRVAGSTGAPVSKDDRDTTPA